MDRKWWHDKVCYQIYPKSFYDANGDGIGDLAGIIKKLDYLKDLGVDILWLSPIYPSPFADQGYDISDYQNIDPRFGTLEEMDTLLKEAHARKMYVLMDLVVNHCSDEHKWFQEAIKDPEGKYGKYFYIEKADAEHLPCNWRSYFGGPVWEPLPGHPELYYLHVFHKKQPDLNWENPELRQEIYDMIAWWMKRGLDGFRLDAIINIKKALPFRSYPADRPDGLCAVSNELHEARGIGDFLGELRDEAFRPYGAFTVGEVFNEKDEELPDFIGENGYFCSMFDFSGTVFGQTQLGWHTFTDITPEDYKDCIFKTQKRISNIGFLSNIIENHDEPRGASRYLPKEACTPAGKKLLAMTYFLLRGLPWIYQGQELGMENRKLSSIDEVDDISSLDSYQTSLAHGLTNREALDLIQKHGRDNARTPFQWNSKENAGFTTGKPWLSVNPNYKEINLEDEQKDPSSVFSFYKKLTRLRKDPSLKDIFVYGTFTPYLPEEKDLFAYVREYENRRIRVLSNFSSERRTVPLPEGDAAILLDNLGTATLTGNSVTLEAYQGVVITEP